MHSFRLEYSISKSYYELKGNSFKCNKIIINDLKYKL